MADLRFGGRVFDADLFVSLAPSLSASFRVNYRKIRVRCRPLGRLYHLNWAKALRLGWLRPTTRLKALELW